MGLGQPVVLSERAKNQNITMKRININFAWQYM